VSDNVRPEKAFAELQQLVRHLGDELAAFRRRALQAEAKVKEFDSAGSVGSVSPQRIQKLEKENAMLNKRLNSARTRTRQMVDRARFLRQQHDGSSR
jgi:predicted  nucleic acid-binding Zn-ribbon protein